MEDELGWGEERKKGGWQRDLRCVRKRDEETLESERVGGWLGLTSNHPGGKRFCPN